MTVLKLLEEIRTPILDQLFQLVTYFGQELIIIGIICVLYWCFNKRFAYILGFTYFTAGLIIQTLKITFRIPRPWVLDPTFHAVESAVPGATGYSFPSGHTMGGTCLFAPLAYAARRRWVKLLCIAAFLMIGFSRLYLGVHTPKDVLVSMGISLLISWLVWKYQSALLDSLKNTGIISLGMALIAVLISIYAVTLLHSGVIDTHYAADCCKTAGAGLGFALGYYLERKYLDFDPRNKSLFIQILKIFIGLGIALFLKEGLKLILGASIPMKMLQYFMVVLWVLFLYPYCFTKVLHKSA